jgi:hypothetical protein
MTQHPEIIAAPYTIWSAPVGTAFPALNAEPGGAWRRVGTNGARNYSGAGVTVQLSRGVEASIPAGNVAPSAVFFGAQELRVSATLLDLTLEQLAHVVSGNPVAIIERLPLQTGYRSIALSVPQGVNAMFALLVRGISPYREDFVAQFEVPRCSEASDGQQIAFRRGEPVGILVNFRALQNPAATSEETLFGRLIAQDATTLIPITTEEDDTPMQAASGEFLEI